MKQAGALLLSLAIIGGTVFPAGQIRAAAETKQPENSMKAATVSDAEKIPGTTVPGLLSRRPETMGKKRSSGGEVYVSASSSNARWDSEQGLRRIHIFLWLMQWTRQRMGILSV